MDPLPLSEAGEVEIYLTLDHPHVARLLMVYEDEQETDMITSEALIEDRSIP